MREWGLAFDASRYGGTIEQILALDGGGNRLMPLVCAECSSAPAKAALAAKRSADLFPGALSPEGALSGLWLYFSCFDECHSVCQDLPSAEGSFWHAILHRQEPDAGNASYWFHRVGRHAIFPALAARARELGFPGNGDSWDPFAFVDFCERARKAGGNTAEHRTALAVQLAEWQLLFDYCARARS